MSLITSHYIIHVLQHVLHIITSYSLHTALWRSKFILNMYTTVIACKINFWLLCLTPTYNASCKKFTRNDVIKTWQEPKTVTFFNWMNGQDSTNKSISYTLRCAIILHIILCTGNKMKNCNVYIKICEYSIKGDNTHKESSRPDKLCF